MSRPRTPSFGAQQRSRLARRAAIARWSRLGRGVLTLAEIRNAVTKALAERGIFPAVNIAGVFVRRDGDVIRIELPGSTLFESGSARLRPGAANLISDVAAVPAIRVRECAVDANGRSRNHPVKPSRTRRNHVVVVATKGRASARPS